MSVCVDDYRIVEEQHHTISYQSRGCVYAMASERMMVDAVRVIDRLFVVAWCRARCCISLTHPHTRGTSMRLPHYKMRLSIVLVSLMALHIMMAAVAQRPNTNANAHQTWSACATSDAQQYVCLDLDFYANCSMVRRARLLLPYDSATRTTCSSTRAISNDSVCDGLRTRYSSVAWSRGDRDRPRCHELHAVLGLDRVAARSRQR